MKISMELNVSDKEFYDLMMKSLKEEVKNVTKKNLELKEKYSSLNFAMKKDKNYFYNQVKYIANLLDDLNFNLNTSFVLDRFVLESRWSDEYLWSYF